MSTVYATTIYGNVDRCRTEAEIALEDGAGRILEDVAVVYEDATGWRVQWMTASQPLPSSALDAAIEGAKRLLSRYVNRRGENPPSGGTRAGLSLWLMKMDDGTAMGRPVSG